MTKEDDALTTWFRRAMLRGSPMPPGVTINSDGRADQCCLVCDELVDSWVGTFSAGYCAHHLPTEEMFDNG
jgi:hypothetical protein